MIAGEIENMIGLFEQDNLAYDNFNFKKVFGKKKLTPEEKAARKAKRGAAFKKAGSFVQRGGLQEAGGTIGDVFSWIKGGGPQTKEDYEINVGGRGKDQPEEKKGIPITAWVVGGLLITGVGILIYKSLSKSNNIATETQQNP